MGFGYIRQFYGDNCHFNDSSFKRYNRYHNRSENVNIFFGSTSHHCCGGGKVSFWNMLGLGLSYNLSGLLMGGIGKLGSWLGLGGNGFGFGGGFGFGNGFGFGGGFGFGNGIYNGGYQAPYLNNGWNNGWNNTQSTTDKTATENITRGAGQNPDGATTVNAEDPDCEKIADLQVKANGLNNDDDLTQEEVDALKAEVNGAKEAQDENNKAANTESYDAILAQIDAVKAKKDALKAQQAQQAQQPGQTPQGDLISGAEVLNQQDGAPVGGELKPVDGEILVNGQPVKISSIPNGEAGVGYITENLKFDDIKNLKPEQATALLDQIGYTTDKNGQKVGQLSNNIKVLLLLEKSGLTVEVEHRAASQDQWIKGPIKVNLNKYNADGIIEYGVDCSNVPDATIKGTYTFTAQDKDGKTYKCSDEDSKTTIKDIVLKYQEEKKPLLNDSGQALVTL